MIFQNFVRLIRSRQLVAPGDKVLLALSGGADSTALLCLFLEIRHQLDLELAVAHLNHGLRGRESEADAEFVRSLAADRQLPCIVEKLPPPERPRRGNAEAWAREQRYRFLQRIGDSLGARRIALGHTRNDQAETVLLRLLRGSGSLGLAAIPVSRGDRFIRPLLSIEREDLRTYLRSRGVGWREDASNRDLRFSRNRVRHELIPRLEKAFHPGIVEVLARTAENLRGDAESLDWLVGELAGRQADRSEGRISWRRSWLNTLPPGLRSHLVRHAVATLDPGKPVLKKQVDAVLELLQDRKSGKSIRVGRIEASREFDRLLFRELPASPSVDSYRFPLGIPGQVQLRQAGLVFETYLNQGSSGRPMLDRWEIYLSPQALARGLEVRSWQAGDAYQPLGSLRPKKIKELFLRKRIGLRARSGWPVVTCGGKIVCAGGFPVAAGAEWRRSSQAAVKVVIEERALESGRNPAPLSERSDRHRAPKMAGRRLPDHGPSEGEKPA